MNILELRNSSQVEELVFSVMVELYQQGHKIVSMGEICEVLGIDKSEIPAVYYEDYYELADFYKEHPQIGVQKINNTIH
jgi:predicted HTH domain antitoxin